MVYECKNTCTETPYGFDLARPSFYTYYREGLGFDQNIFQGIRNSWGKGSGVAF